jgi:O-acetyl-ADP-ribose deacetylase (regulator of RNase III)
MECKGLNGCPTGEARITNGYQLPAKYVIHTVGPVWHGGEKSEATLLASCYKNSLNLAIKNNIRTIAFPNISTGVYRYPKSEAAKIALREVSAFLKKNKKIEKVLFALFDDENYQIYSKELSK